MPRCPHRKASVLLGACRFEMIERRMLLSLSPAGAEFRVNTFTTLEQSSPAIGMDADGDFLIAWECRDQDGSGYGIYAQRYNAAGVTQGAEFRVNTFTTHRQSLPAIGMAADGDFVVAWTSMDQDGSDDGIFAQRYNASGVAQGGEFRVNTFTTNKQRVPAIGMDADGDFVVTWRSDMQDGSFGGIYGQRYSASGVAQGDEFRVNTYTWNEQEDPAIDMHADGEFVVTWQSSMQDGSQVGIYTQCYNAAGVAQGAEFRVNTYTTGSQFAPAIGMDADGDFVVTWSSSHGQDGYGDGIYAQRYNAARDPQGGEFRVNTFTTNDQNSPTISMDADGDFVVTWTSETQDNSYDGVYAQAYNAAGAHQGGEFRVNTFTTGVQFEPEIGMAADGDFVIAWESSGQDGSDLGIYAQAYASIPAVTASSFLFETAPQRLQFTFDDNVSGSLGTNDIVLENLTTMQTIPSSDLALSYDLPSNTATFTYTGNGGGINGVLPDGNYRARLLAAGITNSGGTPIAADVIFDFFFLAGDATRDGRVNLNDFNVLAANFGQSPRTFSQGDFNYDGVVNLDDFNILASRFGVSFAPASKGTMFDDGDDDAERSREEPLT